MVTNDELLECVEELREIVEDQQERTNRIVKVLLDTIPKKDLDKQVFGYDCCNKHKYNWLKLKDFLNNE